MADKKKGIMGEFKEFVMRGNVMNLAVGVIIGGAFSSIVSSLTDDIIMPVITLVTGGIDFSNWFISLDGSSYKTLAAAQEAGAATLNYGKFLSAIINFLIIAFVIFMLVKGINKMMDSAAPKKEEAPAEVTTQTCPFCQSEISLKATRCPHCTSELPKIVVEETK